MASLSSRPRKRRRSGVSQWELAWRRLKMNKAALAGLVIVGVIGVMALLDRLIALYPPNCNVGTNPSCLNPGPDPNKWAIGVAPSWAFPLGTNLAGQDVYSQIVYGARAAFFVGIGATVITMAIATVIGLAAGYFGGWIDNVLMRFTEVVLVLPFFLILLVFLRILFTLSPGASGGLVIIILVIGVFSWPGNARIIRGEVLRVREFEFVAASRQIGASKSRILFRHLFPNTLH